MLLLLLLLFVDGLSAADEMVSVMEGGSVTLQTDLTELLNDDTILWKFGDKLSLIYQIKRENDITSSSSGSDVRFRGRSQVDPNTGSLTVRNTREKHSGKYQLFISRGGTRHPSKTFNVTVQRVAGTDGVKLTSKSVMEGERVTLDSNLTEVHGDDLLLWRFGDTGILLAKLDGETKERSLYDADERFRNRLKLDQTGSLTITDTRTTDSGLYRLQIRGSERLQQFVLTVNRPGVSPGAVAGIVICAVLAVVAAAAGVIYHRHKISQPRTLTVKEGDDVTLKPDKEITEGDVIQWLYGEDEQLPVIAEIRGESREIFIPGDVAGGRFRDRLYLDKTGSLTVRNTRSAHSGHYTLYIRSSGGTLLQTFIVTVSARIVTVNEGKPVHLRTDHQIKQTDEIEWRFGNTNTLIAEFRGTGDGVSDGTTMRGRLELNEKTGDVTIMKSKSGDAGRYKLKISNSEGVTHKIYTVVVIAGSINQSESKSLKEIYDSTLELMNDPEKQPLNE